MEYDGAPRLKYNYRRWICIAASISTLYVTYCVYYSTIATQHSSLYPVMEHIDASIDGKANSSMESIVSIHDAHSLSMPHRGVWLYIVNENDELLLSKRTADTVTCPNTWNVQGEHTNFQETYLETAYRGLKEELGLSKARVASIVPLFKDPLFLDIVYNGPNYKRDLQWTMSYLVRVKQKYITAYNHETSLMQWKPIKHCILWAGGENNHRMCQVKRFQYTSAEFQANNTEWSFQKSFEFHIKLIRQNL